MRKNGPSTDGLLFQSRYPSPLSLRNNPTKRENQPFLVNLRQNSSLFDIRSGKMNDSIHPLSSYRSQEDRLPR